MELFSQNKVYGFMRESNKLFAVSIIFIILSIFFVLTKGLNYGIDFAGGTDIKVKYTTAAPIDKIRDLTSSDPFFSGASVTEFGSKEEVSIRFAGSTEAMGEDVGDKIYRLLQGSGDFEIRSVGMVGPKVGQELRNKGIKSIIAALIVILLYIAVRFEWRFGIAAIISQFHDVIIITGIISLLSIDVNLEVLAAILTLLAYSLNDTIVVFDRIRDEIRKSKDNNFPRIIDVSISNTLSRTILTSATTFFVVVALFIFGGESLSGFSLILVFGVIIGTYSSIFIAAPLLKWLKFDVAKYKEKIALKEKSKKEKEKMRSQYEKGMV